MRFVYAIIAFLLGLVLLGLGITQLTAEREETYTVETEGAEEAPFMVITDDVIDDEEGRDEFTIEAEGEYQIAQGRTYDVEAWLDDAAHNRITSYEASEGADESSRFVAEFIDGETDVPDPSNSDLWVSVETAEGAAPYRWATPDEAGDWALLIFRADGEAAPTSITTTETVTRSAAGGIALTVGGALVILLSLVLFYRALSAPRRKQKQAATASAAATPVAAATEESDSSDADAEEVSQSSTGWSIPSYEAAAEADPDAPTEVVPAYVDDEAAEDSETEQAQTEEEDQANVQDPDEPAQDDQQEPVADLDQPTDVVPAYSEESESGESEVSEEAESEEQDEDREDGTDEDKHDDEDDDPMNTPEADQRPESDPAKKVRNWTDRFRKRLDDGKSPFAVVLAMLVALASGFGLAGPAHADEEADSDANSTDQAEESPGDSDEEATDESESEDADSAEEDSGEDDAAEDEATEDDEDTDASDEDGESTEQDSVDEDEEAPEGGSEDADEDVADPEVEGEMPSEGYSVLLNSQLERILEDIAETVADGDEEQDSELLESRVDGQALALRELAYRNYDLADTAMPTPIGTEVLSAAVSGDPDFPRQALVIVDHPEAEVPQFLVLEQASARENYKLVHTAMMAPGTEFSAYSAEQGGISVLEPGDPDEDGTPAAILHGIANWFADDENEFGEQMAESVYVDALHEYHADLNEAAEDTDIEVPAPEMDDEQIYAMELPDGTMVVAGAFEMTLEMSPISDGDTIFLDNALVEEILGTDWTTFPTQIISQEYVVAQIPPEDSEEEIVLLAVDNLVSDANINTPDWFDGY